MKIARRNSGFTLVELLVVIGIIALLISILLPALSKARDQANSVACASTERQLYAVMMNYAADYKGAMVPARLQVVGTNGAAEFDWCDAMFLGTEMKSNVGNWDTSMTGGSGTDRGMSVGKVIKNLLTCPGADHNADPDLTSAAKAKLTASSSYYGDYVYNTWMGYVDLAKPAGLNPDQQRIVPFRKLTQVPGNVIILMESHKPNVKQTATGWTNVTLPGNGYKNYFSKNSEIWTTDFTSTTVARINGGSPSTGNANTLQLLRIGTPHAKSKKMNVLCADGHIALVDPFKDFFADPTNIGTVKDYLWDAFDNFTAAKPRIGDPNWIRGATGI
jgi:prepilin-type N-terminal cleavage/methylation domain-containing protein